MLQNLAPTSVRIVVLLGALLLLVSVASANPVFIADTPPPRDGEAQSGCGSDRSRTQRMSISLSGLMLSAGALALIVARTRAPRAA